MAKGYVETLKDAVRLSKLLSAFDGDVNKIIEYAVEYGGTEVNISNYSTTAGDNNILDDNSSYIKELLMSCFKEIERETDILSKDEKLMDLGRYYVEVDTAEIIKNTVLLAEKKIRSSGSNVSFPIKLRHLKENLFFELKGEDEILYVLDIYSALAVDIFYLNRNTDIYFFDINKTPEGICELANIDSFYVWDTEKKLDEGLASIEKWIEMNKQYMSSKAAICDECSDEELWNRKKKYIFIRELTDIPPRYYERLLSIINAGCDLGVYVVMASLTDCYKKVASSSEFIMKLKDSIIQMKLDGSLSKIKSKTYMYFRGLVDKNKLEAIKGRGK